MQYRIQFLDGAGKVIREWIASARNVADALELIVDADWPPDAVTMRVLDPYGREVHSVAKGRKQRAALMDHRSRKGPALFNPDAPSVHGCEARLCDRRHSASA